LPKNLLNRISHFRVQDRKLADLIGYPVFGAKDMPTEKQIAANRRNAAKSTGPRTAQGKAVSSMNALKSGVHAQSEIIAGENPADLQDLSAEYIQRFHPTTPEERRYVDTLIRGDWRLRRLARAEAQLWEYTMRHTAFLDQENPLGHVVTVAGDPFARLQRRINDVERSCKDALRELERIQSQDHPEPVAAQPRNAPPPDAQLEEEQTTSPQIGFLRPIPEPAYFMHGMNLEEMLYSISPEGDPSLPHRTSAAETMK